MRLAGLPRCLPEGGRFIRRALALLPCALSLCFGAAQAGPGKGAASPPSSIKTRLQPEAQPARFLDKKRIHELYGEGEFDVAVAMIDSFTRSNPVYPKDDSVFVAKHLAVIYTANPDTREKGKRYMFQLLELLPSAKIVDMFVSDEIDRIFQRVREEYTVQLNLMGRKGAGMESGKHPIDPMAVSPPKDSAAPPAVRRKPSRSRALYWAAGGTVLAVGAGALVYLMLPKESDRNYDIPR